MVSKKLQKVLIPLVIVVLVGGMWYLKNIPSGDSSSFNKEIISSSKDTASYNPDFALEVTDTLDLEKLKSYGVPIIIDFGADSCVPCKEMAPILKELNEEYQGRVIIKFVDVWKYPELSENFPISLIPTQLIFGADGKPFNPENPEVYRLKQYETKDTKELLYTTHEGGLKKENFISLFKELGVE